MAATGDFSDKTTMHDAIQKGDENLVFDLITKDVYVSATDMHLLISFFYKAVEQNNLSVVRKLVEKEHVRLDEVEEAALRCAEKNDLPAMVALLKELKTKQQAKYSGDSIVSHSSESSGAPNQSINNSPYGPTTELENPQTNAPNPSSKLTLSSNLGLSFLSQVAEKMDWFINEYPRATRAIGVVAIVAAAGVTFLTCGIGAAMAVGVMGMLTYTFFEPKISNRKKSDQAENCFLENWRNIFPSS